MRKAIRRLPWVDTVSVQRAWPRGLRVVVSEQVAAARWRENGLLNTRGELFASEARHVPPELAQLSARMAKRTWSRSAISLRRAGSSEAGMRLTALRLDARGAWEFDLSNGVTVRLGRRQVDERFDTFMTHRAEARRAARRTTSPMSTCVTRMGLRSAGAAPPRADTANEDQRRRCLSGRTGD